MVCVWWGVASQLGKCAHLAADCAVLVARVAKMMVRLMHITFGLRCTRTQKFKHNTVNPHMAAGYSNLVEFYEREAVGGTGAAGAAAAGGGGSGEKMDHGDTPSPLVGVKLVFPPATPVTVAAASSPSEAALQGNHTPAADECVHMLPCCCCCPLFALRL